MVDLLTILADRCVDVVDVSAAGLMVASADGDLRVLASSSEAMRVLELFELQADEGPCVDCYRSGAPIVNLKLEDVDSRWPRFSPHARESGFRSVHALPMRLRGQTIGALNMFRVDEGPMPRARRGGGPGAGRRGHHRHPAAPRRPGRPDPERAAHAGPQHRGS